MDSDDAPFAADTPRRTERRGGIVLVLIAFVLGLAVMAGTLHWLGYGPYGTRNQPPAAPAQPQPAMQPAAPIAAPTAATLDTLSAREAMLAGRIAGLEARLASIDTASRTASGFATRAEGMLVAFAVRRAIDRGLALGYLEDQLRRRFGNAEPAAVTTVIAAARQPVTLEDLRLALDTIAPTLSGAAPGESWWDGARRTLSSLVVLRQESTPSARPADRLVRARRRLDAGQVEAALAEVARMPGAANAESWIAAARRFIEARRALNAIETVAIRGDGEQPYALVPAQPPAPPAVAVAPGTAAGAAPDAAMVDPGQPMPGEPATATPTT